MNLQFNGSEMFMQTGGSMAGSDVATQDEHENKQQAVDSAGNQRILRPFWGGVSRWQRPEEGEMSDNRTCSYKFQAEKVEIGEEIGVFGRAPIRHRFLSTCSGLN